MSDSAQSRLRLEFRPLIVYDEKARQSESRDYNGVIATVPLGKELLSSRRAREVHGPGEMAIMRSRSVDYVTTYIKRRYHN